MLIYREVECDYLAAGGNQNEITDQVAFTFITGLMGVLKYGSSHREYYLVVIDEVIK